MNLENRATAPHTAGMSETLHLVCPHCEKINLEPTARLAKVNTDVETSLASEFGIRSIPTLALFKGGREVARQAGAMGKSDIIRWVRQQG